MEGQAYRIRSTRKLRKLSGVDVANKLGISPQYYYDIEKGKKNLSADKAIHLAKIFDVPLDYLLDWDEQINPEFDGDLEKQIKFEQATYEDAMNDHREETSLLSKKEKKDIATDLERIMSDLESEEALAFHGEPIDAEEREILRRSLENSLIIARQLAKKKFTPDKYKKDRD